MMRATLAPGRGSRLAAALATLAVSLLAACGGTPTVAPSASPAAAVASAPAAPSQAGVVGRSERLLVVVPAAGDSFETLAERHLGRADLAWQISEANGGVLQPGQPLVVPRVARNPLGVTPEGVQSVPVLCYHRVGPGLSRMSVAPAQFEAQLQWLKDNGWHVVRLADLAEFMAGRKALPQRSVAITFDDGYESVYRHAFPLLKKHGMPATLFVYTDFVGARDALGWTQMDEMLRSGLVDIQSHSKTHRNLAERQAEDGEAALRAWLDTELRNSKQTIERRLGPAGVQVRHFAYPYGEANEAVLEAMRRNGYEMGFTVTPGGNPFYAAPLLLRRVMIFGEHDLEEFRARLTGRRAARP